MKTDLVGLLEINESPHSNHGEKSSRHFSCEIHRFEVLFHCGFEGLNRRFFFLCVDYGCEYVKAFKKTYISDLPNKERKKVVFMVCILYLKSLMF